MYEAQGIESFEDLTGKPLPAIDDGFDYELFPTFSINVKLDNIPIAMLN